MRPHIIDAFALAVVFGIIEAIATAIFEGRGIFDRPKRRKL